MCPPRATRRAPHGRARALCRVCVGVRTRTACLLTPRLGRVGAAQFEEEEMTSLPPSSILPVLLPPLPPRYVPQFEEEEMTSVALLEEIVGRAEGEKELMEALKEMGIKKMGHRQAIVGAIVGRI